MHKLQKEWFEKGEEYAKAVNEMVAFGQKNGWEKWTGKDPEDKRDHLAKAVFKGLKTANKKNTVEVFREQFPPAHKPFISIFENISQSISKIHVVAENRLIFMVGDYQNEQAYLFSDDKVVKLETSITAIGKSMQNGLIAISNQSVIQIFQDWEDYENRKPRLEFHLKKTKNVPITSIIPFNDGTRVLLVTAEGIFLISQDEERLIHGGDEEYGLAMENACLSHDNRYVVVGEQNASHRVLELNSDGNYEQISELVEESSYPHFCLFSKDDNQLISNTCHFYNGVTLGFRVDELEKVDNHSEEGDSEGDYCVIDDSMRVYEGLATNDGYILGDAYGYIRSVDTQGNLLWQHFLGSTITGMAISNDEKTLWVGSHSGMLHQLSIGKGQHSHTIGTGNHREDFRLLFWKNEPQVWKW